MNRKSRASFGEILSLCAIVIVPLLIVATITVKCIGGVNWEYSSGSRSGVVQKISKKGFFWKTWEGELNLGYNQTSSDSKGNQTIAPAIFYFSVESDNVAESVRKAEVSGNRVSLEYKQYWLRGYSKGGTSYDVVGVVESKD